MRGSYIDRLTLERLKARKRLKMAKRRHQRREYLAACENLGIEPVPEVEPDSEDPRRGR